MKDTDIRTSLVLDRQTWYRFRGVCHMRELGANKEANRIMQEYVDEWEQCIDPDKRDTRGIK